MNSVIEHDKNTNLHIFRNQDSSYNMDSFHSHDMHELYFLERGNAKYFIGSDIYALNPGDLIFVPAGEYHQTDYSECTKAERIIFCFDNALVGSRYLKYISELIADKHVHIPNEYSEKINNIIYNIEQENINKHQDYKILQKIYLRELLILISRYRVTRENSKLTENDKLVQQITKYISTNYGENLSLETLSKRYCISQGHLSKVFKKTTGVNLNEYISIARVSAAQDLLETSNLPIVKIAYLCGFNDSNYFTQVFKKTKGITPKKYSKQFHK